MFFKDIYEVFFRTPLVIAAKISFPAKEKIIKIKKVKGLKKALDTNYLFGKKLHLRKLLTFFMLLTNLQLL